MSQSRVLDTEDTVQTAVLDDDLMTATGPGRVVTLADGRRAWWRPEDAAWGVALAGRALTNLGVGAADRVLVALTDPLHRDTFLGGVEAIGAQGAPESAHMPEGWATVLITEPFRAFMEAGRPFARVILAHGPETGQAAMEWYRGRLAGEPAVGELWLQPELPGPLALRCEKGRFHITTDGMEASWSSAEEVTQVRVRREGMAGFQQGRVLTRDWVRPSACDCGSDGLAFAAVVDRGRPMVAGDRRLFRRDIIDALFRVPGFAGSAVASLRYDRPLGRDYLVATVSALSGWDPRKVAEAVEYAFSLRFHIPARADGVADDGRIGIVAEDRRGV